MNSPEQHKHNSRVLSSNPKQITSEKWGASDTSPSYLDPANFDTFEKVVHDNEYNSDTFDKVNNLNPVSSATFDKFMSLEPSKPELLAESRGLDDINSNSFNDSKDLDTNSISFDPLRGFYSPSSATFSQGNDANFAFSGALDQLTEVDVSNSVKFSTFTGNVMSTMTSSSSTFDQLKELSTTNSDTFEKLKSLYPFSLTSPEQSIGLNTTKSVALDQLHCRDISNSGTLNQLLSETAHSAKIGQLQDLGSTNSASLDKLTGFGSTNSTPFYQFTDVDATNSGTHGQIECKDITNPSHFKPLSDDDSEDYTDTELSDEAQSSISLVHIPESSETSSNRKSESSNSFSDTVPSSACGFRKTELEALLSLVTTFRAMDPTGDLDWCVLHVNRPPELSTFTSRQLSRFWVTHGISLSQCGVDQFLSDFGESGGKAEMEKHRKPRKPRPKRPDAKVESGPPWSFNERCFLKYEYHLAASADKSVNWSALARLWPEEFPRRSGVSLRSQWSTICGGYDYVEKESDTRVRVTKSARPCERMAVAKRLGISKTVLCMF
eukprot:995789_1